MDIGIYEIDLDTCTFLNVSPIMCQGLGYDDKELIGHPVSKVLTPESMKHFMSRLARMQEGEMLDGQVQYNVKCKDGAMLGVEIEAFYKIENGRARAAIVAAKEVYRNG